MAAPTYTYSGNVYSTSAAGTVDFPLISTSGNAILYLEASHIHVYSSGNSGSTWTELTRPAQWGFNSGGTVVRLTSGIASGTWIKVKRLTPVGGPYVTFQPSSLLTAEQLNDESRSNSYVNQETLDDADLAAAEAAEAVAAAATATASAAAAAASAAAAVSTADTSLANSQAASQVAATALTNSQTSLTQAAAAVSTANSSNTTAANASSVAGSASAAAASATATANSANAKADSAIAAISSSAVFAPVANVAAIPANPASGQSVQVSNSTGIESFTPLAGLPAGFVGDSGLAARIQYSGSTWNWYGYVPNDSDGRYLKKSGGTLTGPLTLAGAPTSSLQPATKGYVDSNFAPITNASFAGTTQVASIDIATEARFSDADASHYVALKAPSAVGMSKVFTLPAQDGLAGHALTTDGNGALTFSPSGDSAFVLTPQVMSTSKTVAAGINATIIGPVVELTPTATITIEGNSVLTVLA